LTAKFVSFAKETRREKRRSKDKIELQKLKMGNGIKKRSEFYHELGMLNI
jgi:hypothetical protein